MNQTNLIDLIPKINYPWDEVNDPSFALYYMSRSAEKRVSQLVAGMVDEDKQLTDIQLKMIADVISMTYATRWRRDYATLDLDYDPTENYDMFEDGDETRTPDTTTTTTRTPDTTTTTTTTPDTTTTTTRTPGTTTTTTTTPDTTTTTTRAPDTTTTTTPDTTTMTAYDGYKETDTLTYTGRKDTRTTSDAPASVTDTETWTDYREHETETVPGKTDARTASSRTSEHSAHAFNEANLIPESKDTGSETWTDTTTAGAAGEKSKDITGTHARATATTAPGSGSDTLERTGTETHGIAKTGAMSETETGSVTVTETGTDTTTVTASGTDTTAVTVSGTDTTAVTASGTDTTTVTASGTDTTTVAATGTDTTHHDMHRHGNIGVTTTQQMIAAEREVNRYAFYERVADDMDDILTARIYLLADVMD